MTADFTIVRRLRLTYLALSLVVLVGVIAMIAIGGRHDPAGPAHALYGTWRFHPGDDPSWADPEADDSSWERFVLNSTPDKRDTDVGLPGLLDGWSARGFSDLQGYGWYRLRVQPRWTGDLVLLGPTMVDDSYQIFWNGKLVGGVGTFGRNPRVSGARPVLVRLPRPTGDGSTVLAIRTFMQPGLGRDHQSGGLRSAPILAVAAFGEQLHQAQWRRTIAGYIVEVGLALMMLLLAALALFLRPRARAFSNWLAVALAATALLRLGNAVSAWTDLLDLMPHVWLNAILLSPLAMLAWIAAWNNWTEGPGQQPVYAAAIAAWASRVAGTVTHSDGLSTAGRLVSLALFAVVALRIARRGDHRTLALSTMLAIGIGLFINEITKLGVPDIWFPFNIGVTLTQYAYALALPLICLAITAGAAEKLASPARPQGSNVS